MPGHVFLVQGDLRRLACDALLIPSDDRGEVREKWLLPDSDRPRVRLPAGWASGAERVAPVEAAAADEPAAWVVNVRGDEKTPAGWYAEGVRQFCRQAYRRLSDRGKPPEGRRWVLALPLVGTGSGGGRERAGEVLTALLQTLWEETAREGCDAVLVARDGPALAAAQAARQQAGGTWPELTAGLKDAADELARRASEGDLALFLGAGVSAGAGLPLWDELLGILAERARMSRADRAALDGLHPLDQAGVLESRLGGPRQLRGALAEIFHRRRYSPGHALLAALPVREVVTTNYDRLFEMAWQAMAVESSVLPYEVHHGTPRWLLKMHGSIDHHEDIVLTRSDQVGYDRRHAALAGILQTLLLTRHMLFVGFSMNDDNFHRIADAARQVVKGAGEGRKPFGTVLTLEPNPLLEELWSHDLEWVGMNGPGKKSGKGPARRLLIFLDYLLAQTREAAHLLDDRYESVLTPGEREVRNRLRRLTAEMSEEARASAPWALVERLLAELGQG